MAVFSGLKRSCRTPFLDGWSHSAKCKVSFKYWVLPSVTGIVLLNLGILLNLYNAFRARDWGRFFFDSNGLAGWILYLSFLIVMGQLVGNLILRPRDISELCDYPGRNFDGRRIAGGGCLLSSFKTLDGKDISLIEGGWGHIRCPVSAEVLEKFISMFSNTLSYVRVGAFAIVHAGFTGAVFVIARLVGGGEEAGFGYWAVVVFGNLFVIGLEGFIVAIQTMRLHYYEFFSKFFQGGGSPYEPLGSCDRERKVTELLSEQYSIIQKEKKDDQNCYCDTGNTHTPGSVRYVLCEPAQ